jgi:hypothetical protein
MVLQGHVGIRVGIGLLGGSLQDDVAHAVRFQDQRLLDVLPGPEDAAIFGNALVCPVQLVAIGESQDVLWCFTIGQQGQCKQGNEVAHDRESVNYFS